MQILEGLTLKSIINSCNSSSASASDTLFSRKFDYLKLLQFPILIISVLSAIFMEQLQILNKTALCLVFDYHTNHYCSLLEVRYRLFEK